jgi:Brp/Blh family beta-carotene 15,15'-monooxygenase
MIFLEPIRKRLLIVGILLVVVTKAISIPEQTQMFVFFAVLAITGVPHGSLDFFIQKKIITHSNKLIFKLNFIFKYLINMLAYGILWYFFPSFAFILFIGLTAYHFGEIDWQIHQKKYLDRWLYSLFGLLLIVFIIVSHIDYAAPVLAVLLPKFINQALWIKIGNSFTLPIACILLAYLLTLVCWLPKIGYNKNNAYSFAFQAVVLIVVIYLLPFYLSFAFYFGCWHSLISFNLIRNQLEFANTYKGWLELIKKAIPYTVLAWTGIVFFILFTSKFQNNDLIISNIFIGISILTLPHLQVFTKIVSLKKQ